MRLRMMTPAVGLVLAALLSPVPSRACSLCFNIKQTATLRQEAASPSARLILFGTLSNARLTGDRLGAGTTDFTVVAVLRTDPTLTVRQRKQKGDVVVLPLYLPPQQAGTPAYCLVFCDVSGSRCDPYRPLLVTAAASAYLRPGIASPGRPRPTALLFPLPRSCRRPAVPGCLHGVRQGVRQRGRRDRAAAAGCKVADVAARPEDAGSAPGAVRLPARQSRQPFGLRLVREGTGAANGRTAAAFDGILGGYIRLRPQEGWRLAARILREGKQSLPVRLSVVRTLRLLPCLEAGRDAAAGAGRPGSNGGAGRVGGPGGRGTASGTYVGLYGGSAGTVRQAWTGRPLAAARDSSLRPVLPATAGPGFRGSAAEEGW